MFPKSISDAWVLFTSPREVGSEDSLGSERWRERGSGAGKTQAGVDWSRIAACSVHSRFLVGSRASLHYSKKFLMSHVILQ